MKTRKVKAVTWDITAMQANQAMAGNHVQASNQSGCYGVHYCKCNEKPTIHNRITSGPKPTRRAVCAALFTQN